MTAVFIAPSSDLVQTERFMRVYVDRLRIEQALGNLVDNALRHGTGAVRIAVSRSDQGVELGVSDSGPGFAADVLPRAFERFSRSDFQRAGGGSGLGLAIVRTIAEAHGGTVEVAGEAGAGASVRVRLPIDRIATVA